MDEAKLEELAASIHANGVIQPILVRRTGEPIASSPASGAGARRSALACSRCRSSCATSPDGSEKQLLELALIENIQRENLNPLDEALAYQRLADEFGLTHDQIAAAVGKDRSSVANMLRLLKLADEVRADLASGALSMGHARALLALADPAPQRQASREVISRALSVRDTEALVRKRAGRRATRHRALDRTEAAEPPKDVHTRAAEDRLRFALGTKVRIVRRGQGGTIEIDFGSEAELNRIYDIHVGK